ncbi:Retrovirus-related Pol polyprotein from transposon RE1-like protein [Drosera capensis]
MKNLGEVGCFLGLEVEKSDQGYFVSHKGYARKLLERFNMGESKDKATPMEPYLKLKKDEGKPLKDLKKFRQLVGSLIYLTITRPEISYSVSVVSQFMQNPNDKHLDVAKMILRYVKRSINHGLWYKDGDRYVLSGSIDADWAGDPNDSHSMSGYCFNTGSAIISWCRKKQDVVALSSTETEYMTTTMAAQECIWLKRLIGDMLSRVDYAVEIKCDNMSAIKLASNPVFHARIKHIAVKHHFVRERARRLN